MPTVHRSRGLRFVIFSNDHEPVHVHAIGGGGEAKIDLGVDGRAPSLMWVKGLSNADVRRAMAEVASERDRLLEARTRIHGRNEP